MRKVAGIDVHKEFLEVAYRLPSGRIETKQVEYTPKGISRLIKLLRRHGITDVYMESTGDYYLPLYYALKGAGIRPHVMNAYKIRRPEPNKTDKKDAIWLLEIGESEFFSDSYVPDEDIQALRFLIRKRMKLVDRISDIKREINSILWRLGLQVAHYAKKLRSKKKRMLLLALLEGRLRPDSINDSDVRHLYDILSRPEFRAYVFVLRSRLVDLAHLESQLEEFDREIVALARKFENTIRILMSVPGISFILAVGILAEIGDINRFPSPAHLASYAGLVPTARNSAVREGVVGRQRSRISILGAICFWLVWPRLGVIAGLSASFSRVCWVGGSTIRLLLLLWLGSFSVLSGIFCVVISFGVRMAILSILAVFRVGEGLGFLSARLLLSLLGLAMR